MCYIPLEINKIILVGPNIDILAQNLNTKIELFISEHKKKYLKLQKL